MNKCTLPEYGKEVLSTLFSDVEIRDYSKIEHCKDKFPIWGIMVLAYSERHKDMYARIKYLPSSEIVFSIEVDQNTWMDETWKSEDVDESTYEYFIFIIDKIISDMNEFYTKNNETYSHISKFNSKYWISRQKKINSII